MRSIPELLGEHPFFAGLDDNALATLAGCADTAQFEPGEYLFRVGDPADFYALLRGRVQLEVSGLGWGSLALQPFHRSDVLGWSWLVPPYCWEAAAQATEQTDAIVLSGACLRTACDENPVLGYELLKRVITVMSDRSFGSLVRVLDLAWTWC